MGDPEGGPLPSGLIHTQAAPYADSFVKSRSIDNERWRKAEQRTEELIRRIRGTRSSEARRKDVADYVRFLIQKCFECQVNTFGSVPLKTYLPDGDIDLTIVSRDPRLKETWASAVRSALEKVERNKDGKYRVREVQYINAEVKIIKCRVENIVVDISFNQFGGLCTLCFLEEVDRVIGNDHFFKRSIILVKAWCYYESAILGAHHGLISTYALETLVLYIFHVFHNSLRGPLEVLLRFLEFFSKFDWHKYAVSVWGPIPLSSLPDMLAEPPRKDGGELLLSKDFLDACLEDYAVFLTGPDTSQTRAFTAKHLNVVDPLRTANNLGRSVNQTNFNRITKVLGHSAEKLLKILLDTSKDIDAYFDDKKAGFFRRTKHRLDQFEEKRPDAAAKGAAQYATTGYEGLHYQNYHQNGWVMGQVVDNGDNGHSYVPETNLRNNQEGWISEVDQRQQSSTPSTQMGGSHSNSFHTPGTSNGGLDTSQVLSDNGVPGGITISTASVPEASQPPGGYTGGKGRFSNGEAVAKPLGIIPKSNLDSGDGTSMEILTKTSRQQGDARGSVGSFPQSSEGQDVASFEYRSSYTQTNFDSNGALVSSSESPSSESSRGSVSFSTDAVPEGTVPSKRSSISNHTVETEVSRRSSWAGEQPSYAASNGFIDGHGYSAQQRGGQESVSRVSIPLPVSVSPHTQIPVTLPHQGPMPLHLATTMTVSQPMTLTGPSPSFVLHSGNVSTSMIGESPMGIDSRVGPYYAIRGPPVPPLPPGYFHGPPPLAQHHLSPTGEILNGRISTPFPVQQAEDQGFEQQQQQQAAWQQMEQMQQQINGHGYLRPVSTMNATSLSPPSPQLLNSETPTVIPSVPVGGYGLFHVPVSLPATQRSQSAPIESLANSAVGDEVSQELQPEAIGKSRPRHGGEVGNPTTAAGGKSSSQVGSESGAGKNFKTGKEKRASSKKQMASNEDVSDVGMPTSVAEGFGHHPTQAIADDTSVQMRQGHPHLVPVSGGPAVGSSVYPHFVPSSLPLHGTALMPPEISPYPPPPMLPTPKLNTVGYTSLPSQTSIQAPVELVNGGSSSHTTKQRQRPTESAPLPPNVYFPPGNPYPLLSMQRVYVVPPSPPDQAFIGLDAFGAMHFSKPFDSYIDLSAAGQGDDSRLRLSQQQQGRPGVGERLRAAGVPTSSIFSSEATSTTDARASDGVESNFIGGDLLSSDLSNHVRNLHYARSCQDKQVPFPMAYGPQYMAPALKHYQDYRKWEGPGRPLTANANMYSNVMNYGHGIVQGPPSMSNSVRMVGSFPRSFAGPGSFGSDNNDLPKSHGGTGLYVPNPRPAYVRDRHSSANGRNQHAGYSQERGERGDREVNQVNGPRLRARGQGKYEPRPPSNNVGVERSNADLKGGERGSRDRDIHRQYEGQRRNPPTQAGPGSAFTSPQNVGVAPLTMMSQSPAGPPVEMYSVPNMTGNGKSSTSGTVGGTIPPPLVMVAANPLEFGSVGQVQVGASQPGREVDNGVGQISSLRIHEQVNAPPGSAGLSSGLGDGSSQGPSSPKQGLVQGAYQLTEDDFPPLSFRGQH